MSDFDTVANELGRRGVEWAHLALERIEARLAEAERERDELREALAAVKAVMLDAQHTYGYVGEDGAPFGPMMVERDALLAALGIDHAALCAQRGGEAA
ncbi:hypothetical protein Gocc_2940 [Gaiella occulta]|uniref:Uncharacterized protein n=1 Tax=Gaiella occulta TaxID=1002870 RepID=A0A7M2YUC5_9ACTN|nr:hypothetical protein [Gaiella occulta]RDI73340.1 hypothetical protein Gocc_2940 [Gaiella occulta]